MHKQQVIVFDFDGTLVTCENKQKYALLSILNRNSIIEPELLEKWWKLKREGFSSADALNDLNIPGAESIAEEWARIIEDFQFALLEKPFSDTIETLDLIKNSNFETIILSARRHKLQLMQTIYRYGFDQYIDDIIITSPIKAASRKAAYLNMIRPYLFIGDTESDFQAAKESNTPFIALSRGQRSYSFLNRAGINKIANNLNFLHQFDKVS